jgi:hypothetical protein
MLYNEKIRRVWILSHVSQWLRRGFGLVIGFLEVVTTINYNTVTDSHTTKHSTLISSVYLHLPSRIYNTGTIKVSLNHTFLISLYYNTHTVFKSHVKSSHADFLYSSVLLAPIRFELSAQGSRYIAAEWTWTYSKHFTWSLSSQSIGASVGTAENTASSVVACWTVFTELLPGNMLIKSVALLIYQRNCTKTTSSANTKLEYTVQQDAAGYTNFKINLLQALKNLW